MPLSAQSIHSDKKRCPGLSGNGLPHAHLLLSGQLVDLTAVSLSNSEPLHELGLRRLEIAVHGASSAEVQ